MLRKLDKKLKAIYYQYKDQKNPPVPVKTDKELYNTQNAFNLLPKAGWSHEFLLSIINSKLMSFYHRKKFPIRHITLQEQKKFTDQVNKMNKLIISQKEEVREFKRWLRSTFKIDKLSKNLDRYYKLSVEDFLEEIRRKFKKN